MRHNPFRENFVDSCGCKYCLSFKFPQPTGSLSWVHNRRQFFLAQIKELCDSDVWCPGTKCLREDGPSNPLLRSGLCSAWGHPCTTTRAGHLCPLLVLDFPPLPNLLASSEMVIPLTRKVMTPIHYFKCHFCKGINRLSVRLDYILILIVLKSYWFLNTFFCSLNFSRAVSHLVSLYLAVISPLWKFDRREPLFSGPGISLACAHFL